jgi:peroxiredoxin family protein
MTALETLKADLIAKQIKLLACHDDNGFIFSSKRYEYRELVREVKGIREAIEYLEEKQQTKVRV